MQRSTFCYSMRYNFQEFVDILLQKRHRTKVFQKWQLRCTETKLPISIVGCKFLYTAYTQHALHERFIKNIEVWTFC